MKNPLTVIYKFLVFKAGDTRWLGWRNFPFVATWDVCKPEIKGEEVQTALRRARKGDVLVLRHDGFVSNFGIGGAMIHAALCIGEDHVIEALSDDEGGVVKTHLSDCLQADKAMLLRPINLCDITVNQAVATAHSILGFKYDIFFDFNTEEERESIRNDHIAAKAGTVKFCCTEIPHYCYLDSVQSLDLYRTRNSGLVTKLLTFMGLAMGDTLITADMYLEANFEVVWASKGCTPEWFSSKKCCEETLARVTDYWKKSTSA